MTPTVSRPSRTLRMIASCPGRNASRPKTFFSSVRGLVERRRAGTPASRATPGPQPLSSIVGMADAQPKPPIPRPVWFLGFTSLFTDAANEVIYPLLPMYLSRVLGATAVSLGIIEGVAEGLNSLLRVLAGFWSDHRKRRRPIVIGGYALSSFARPFIALTTTWPQVLVIR